jgi:hypothetical protein
VRLDIDQLLRRGVIRFGSHVAGEMRLTLYDEDIDTKFALLMRRNALRTERLCCVRKRLDQASHMIASTTTIAVTMPTTCA